MHEAAKGKGGKLTALSEQGAAINFPECPSDRHGSKSHASHSSRRGPTRGVTAVAGQNRPLSLAFTNTLGFKHKQLKPQGRGSGVSDLSETREPTHAPKTQTRGASVPIPTVACKERSSQSNCIEWLRYSWPRLAG